ncbi:hypothetical protein M569_12154 [Genlisea aurea]|uniref:Myb-like domain-containing protein n=1 Tax=Genlisea aurea TaxID=192259 RepID=S8DS46_9LAMI|nr:hypothetical protein M569_12154 [Genlisea aurea]
MATVISPPSPSNPDDDHLLPTATLALPSVSASRRLPPPCWSPEETVALIDAYRDKWYSLRRGNLRANHWQEVSEDIASRCPTNPPKTAVQCRHKMEKLRKRYRAEIQRAASRGGGVRHFSSSWVHFQKMHTMERGPNPTPPSSSDDDEEDDDNNNNDDDGGIKRIHDLYNTHNHRAVVSIAQGSASGVRIKIPGRSLPAPHPQKATTFSLDDSGIRNPNFRFNSNSPATGGVNVNGGVSSSKTSSKKKKVGNPGIDDLVAAIQSVGEGYARIEMAKMEIAKKVEEMRMDLEMKRTKMIVECQQRILEAFSESISDGRNTKRARRSSTPPEE